MKEGDRVEITRGGWAFIHKSEWEEYQKARLVAKERPSAVFFENETSVYFDPRPDLVGLEGTVEELKTTQGIENAAVVTDKLGYIAWFNTETQLKKVDEDGK